MANDKRTFGNRFLSGLQQGGLALAQGLTAAGGNEVPYYSNFLESEAAKRRNEIEGQKAYTDYINSRSDRRLKAAQSNYYNAMGKYAGNIGSYPGQPIDPNNPTQEGFGPMISGFGRRGPSYSMDTPQAIYKRGQDLFEKFTNQKPVEDFNKFQPAVSSMEELANSARGASGQNLIAIDQGIITQFNKILDPPSVVRESEYLRSAADAPLFNRWKAAVTRVQSGGRLTQSDRDALVDGAKIIANSRGEKYNELYDQYEKQYKKAKVNSKDYLGDRFKPYELKKTGSKSKEKTGFSGLWS